MTTRTVRGTMRYPNGDPWNNAKVRFTLVTTHATASDASIMRRQVEAITDLNGDFSIDLEVPDVDAWRYHTTAPDGSDFFFNLDAGASINYHTLQFDNNDDATVTPSEITGLISGKADKANSPTLDNVATVLADGNFQDSGTAIGDLATDAEVTAALTGKIDTVSGATLGNLPSLLANGQLVDSGLSASSLSALSPPTNLTASSSFLGQVVLSWTDAANANTYIVERKTDNSFQQLGQVGTGGSFVDNNAPVIGDAIYRVRSVSNSGLSAYSEEAAVTSSVTYLLLHQFTEPEQAPLLDPNPGDVGNLDVLDPNNILSAYRGELKVDTGASATYTLYDDSSRTRTLGLAFRFDLATGNSNPLVDIGWGTSKAARPDEDGFFFTGGNLRPRSNNTTLNLGYTHGTNETVECLVVLRATGAFWYLKGPDYTEWTLVWVDDQGADSTLYAGWGRTGTVTAHGSDNWEVVDQDAIGLNWGAEADVYDAYVAAPADGAEEANAPTDIFTQFDWVAGSSETVEVDFRYLDAENGWRVQLIQSSGTVKIQQVRDGTASDIVTDSGSTFTASSTYRIRILAEGTTIRVFVDNADILTYTTATRFTQERGCKLSGHGDIDDWYIWDATPSATFPFEHKRAAQVEIITPESYEIIQRSGTTADIDVTGTYVGTPTAIEARFNGGAWATIDATPTGGTFSGTLSSQAEGQGPLEVRFTNDAGAIDTAQYVGIGDVFVIAGQSNASGRGDNNQTYSHASLKAGLFDNTYHWGELLDETDGSGGQVDSVSADGTTGGSIWPLLATSIMADQGVPVGFVVCAMGGTSISSWQKGTANDRATLYGSMQYRVGQLQNGCKAVLFHQGEANAVAGTAEATYNTDLDSFADDVNTDLGVKTVVAKIHEISTATTPNITNIQNAIDTAWGDNANVVAGPDLDGETTSPDGAHYTTDAEMLGLAADWWTAIQTEFYP